MTAAMSPAMAGAPEARDNAMDIGKATKDTTKPAFKSDCQFSTKPLNPFLGLCMGEFFSGVYDQYIRWEVRKDVLKVVLEYAV